MREKQENHISIKSIEEDMLEELLVSVYPKEPVPEVAKRRLQNQLAYQAALGTKQISFWWLPATIATSIALVAAVFVCLIYVIVNLTGAHMWMPNFLQFVSEIWLKINLLAIIMEVAVSWIITMIGVWKANLVKSARIL